MKKILKYLPIIVLILLSLSTPALADASPQMALIGLGLGGISLLICAFAFLMTLIILLVVPGAIVFLLFIFNTVCAIMLGIFYLWLCIPENQGIELTLLLPFFWFIANIIATILKKNFPSNLRAILKNGSVPLLIACIFLFCAHARNRALKIGINIAREFGGDVLSNAYQIDLLQQYGINLNQEPTEMNRESEETQEGFDTNSKEIENKDTEESTPPNTNIEAREISPLFTAIMKRDNAEVAKIIAEGADVNEKNEYTYTPLMYAVIYGDEDIIKQLLNANADINATTSDEIHFNALKLAGLYNKPEIAELLKAAGAKE